MFDCILLMAGKGLRAKLEYNKTLYLVNNQPLYMFSLKEFLEINECQRIIIVTSSDDIDNITQEVARLEDDRIMVIIGGKTRQESVFNGMKYVRSQYVLIHDAARPFINKTDILNVYYSTLSHQAAVLAVPVKDSVKVVNEGFVHKTIDRNSLYAMQTPQGIKSDIFRKCLDIAKANNYLGTDDVELVEKFSEIKVRIVEGRDENTKITTPRDLKILDLYKGE